MEEVNYAEFCIYSTNAFFFASGSFFNRYSNFAAADRDPVCSE